jgi:hypothetical protein
MENLLKNIFVELCKIRIRLDGVLEALSSPGENQAAPVTLEATENE